MRIKASAPGRCGILGNPSDIYGGKVLSCSLPARNTCILELGGPQSLPSDPTLWNAATARFPISDPVSVTWESQVPRSSGLAGSTALLAATLACVLKAQGQSPDFTEPEVTKWFAELVRDVERYEANVMCGYQDAYMVVHGGLRLMDFTGKHPVEAGPHANLTSIEAPLPFLLITTGVERLSGSVHGPMSERWLAGEKLVVDAMATLSQLAEPGAAALQRGDLRAVAEAMTLNQRLITELGGSGDAIDRLIERATTHGALAAKLAGAGMGGTVIALTEDAEDLEAKLRTDGYSLFLRPKIEPGLVLEKL